jgi:hypothetical protein
VPNAPEETVIAAAMEGLAIGQCVAHFARNYPTSVRELFKVMRQYARLDDDLKKQKTTRNSWRQAGKAPRPPPTQGQRNMRPFRAINNLQEQPEHNSAEPSPHGPYPSQQYRCFDHSLCGGRGGRTPRGGREGRGRGPRTPYLLFVAKILDISQKTANTTKWLENSRIKTRPQKAAKHLITYSTTPAAKQQNKVSTTTIR